MSKNLDGLSALNLSLDGRSIKSSGSNTSNNVNNNNNSANKKPPLTNNLGTNRTNHSNVSSVRDTYRFKRKTSIDRNVILKGREEEKKKQEENEIKQSNVFKPSSQQSSIDASVSENLSQRNYFQKEIRTETNKPPTSDPLDLFFRDEPKTTNKHDSFDLNESREEKINKLKESTDSLRKELQLETLDLNASTNSSSNNNSADKNQAASKIQNWYRENQSRRDSSDKEDEIKKLLQEKNTEMVKKMEKFNQMTLESSKKPKTYIIKKQIGKDKLLTPKKSVNKETSPVTSERYQIEPIQVASQSQPQPQQTPAATSNNNKTNNSSSENNPTIESLLMELDKIDRESELILNSEAKSDNKTKLTSERGNSLLQFLDELDKKEVSTTPRAFKDLREFENDAISLLKAQRSRENKTTTTINSSRKSILKEDDVEKPTKPLKRESSSSKIKETLSFNTEKTKQQQPSNSEELLLKAKTVQNDLKTKISTQNAEIDEKNKIISKLEKDLSQQRELTLRHAQEADKEMQQRLQVQKNDYEATIQRHLNFIDQLIDDKKVLSEKCEKLVIELKESEKRNSDKIRTLEEKFKVETHKSKEMLEAAEKLRREKWIEEKTKKIKEMTVKGLEPEIQALINKHKNEIKSMKAVHEAELMQADERAAQRYIKITEELRENYEREKEAAIQRERDVSKQRYEKSLQDEEKSFLEQRRRLYAEIEEEKNRLAEVAAQQRKELDKQKRMLEENNFNAIEAIRKEYADNQKETEKKHQTEIQNLKEKLDIEKQSWEQNFLKKQENWMLQKERELKEQIKKERDKEIETLIARLETESTTSREEIERTAENRVKRIRDKYESELREVERTERETMERYNTVKAKYNEIEGEFERLKTVVKQKDRDLEGIKKLTDTLQEERNRLADVLRQEFADRIVFAEEENKRLKLDIAEMKSKHQFEQEKKREETEKLKRENAEELNKVHEKIKQVVTKKDEAYNQLKQQYDSACKRADHLEGLLEQQRALMLKKANDNNK